MNLEKFSIELKDFNEEQFKTLLNYTQGEKSVYLSQVYKFSFYYVLSLILFYLVRYSVLSYIDLSFFRIDDKTIVFKLIPILSSYFLYQTAYAVNKFYAYHNIGALCLVKLLKLNHTSEFISLHLEKDSTENRFFLICSIGLLLFSFYFFYYQFSSLVFVYNKFKVTILLFVVLIFSLIFLILSVVESWGFLKNSVNASKFFQSVR